MLTFEFRKYISLLLSYKQAATYSAWGILPMSVDITPIYFISRIWNFAWWKFDIHVVRFAVTPCNDDLEMSSGGSKKNHWFQPLVLCSWNQQFFLEPPQLIKRKSLHGVTANLSISYFISFTLVRVSRWFLPRWRSEPWRTSSGRTWGVCSRLGCHCPSAGAC